MLLSSDDPDNLLSLHPHSKSKLLRSKLCLTIKCDINTEDVNLHQITLTNSPISLTMILPNLLRSSFLSLTAL